MRKSAAVAVALLAAVQAYGDTAPDDPASTSPSLDHAVVEEPDTRKWSFSASVNTYVVPDDHDYVQPTVTADRGWLHLEGRYNYEALETGSAWLGYNFAGGQALTWEFIPMLGGVFGDTWGVAPGYEGSLGWWKLELYSEGEYVFDTGDRSASFFYNWSEVTLAPLDWFRFGLVTQRTRAYQADRDIQRGVLAGLSYHEVDLTTYVLDPDASAPTVVVAVAVSF